MQEQMKILVSGDVEGKLDQLYARVKKIQKKAGPFEMLFCVGNFFGHGAQAEAEWGKYVSGTEKAPIPTYILGSNLQEHNAVFNDSEEGELAQNIIHLGKKGVFSSTSGLQVAYISGTEQPQGMDKKHYHFTEDDVTSLIESCKSSSTFKGVDILLTSAWPRGVSQYATQPEDIDTNNTGSKLLAEADINLKPRYHFAGLHQTYYERAPYRNHKVLAETAVHVTRFIGLANVGNKDKKKYLYAFNIIPMCEMPFEELTKQPEDVTECPFTKKHELTKDKSAQRDMSNQYFFDSKSYERKQTSERGSKRHHGQDESPQTKKHKAPPKPTGPCWFCLGSPQVEKHLVVSVGTHTYLALAKGGLVVDHILILPIGHYQSSVDLTQDSIEEIEKYKLCLRQMFKHEGKCCVIFERNFRSQHLQLQVVPVPDDNKDIVNEVFQEYSQQQKLETNEIPKHSDLKQIISTGSPFFYVELDSGEKLFHRIKKGFPLQFGREVLASPKLLNMPERADWKACAVSKDLESKMAADFRKKFKDFDFTLK